ncbi:MAG: histidine triad (HIT) family protein [Candidatus Deianiraeaceae bacterium]|jgi:histidine triad (HIT) family protein
MSSEEKYDHNNIFAKIILKEIPAKIVFESDSILAFEDINPKAKTHILVVPKGQYANFTSFTSNAPSGEISSFFQTVNNIATNILKLQNFKILTNNGYNAGQEVFHFHIHILSSSISSL